MKRRLRRAALCSILVLGGLQACAPGGGLAPIAEYRAEVYRLGGGDRIRVITFGEEQLTGEFRVDDTGRIALPLLGGVKAAGLTPDELDKVIADGLKRRKLLRDPSVAVEVVAYRPVFVLGEVAKPGQYPYQPGMTMQTTVAIAGGYTYRGVQDYASVVRSNEGHATEGLVRPSSFVAPGDVIKVYERRF